MALVRGDEGPAFLVPCVCARSAVTGDDGHPWEEGRQGVEVVSLIYKIVLFFLVLCQMFHLRIYFRFV